MFSSAKSKRFPFLRTVSTCFICISATSLFASIQQLLSSQPNVENKRVQEMFLGLGLGHWRFAKRKTAVGVDGGSCDGEKWNENISILSSFQY